MKDASDADQKMGELTAQLAAASHRSEEALLTAPIAGTVQDLAVHTIGGVVTPAQALLTVVPDQGPVMIEANVENKDVGFVHAGQDVEVKVETFTFTRYGLMHGHVVDLSRDAAAGRNQARPSADSSEDSSVSGSGISQAYKAPTYVVHVALSRDALVINGQQQQLYPGMSITAEIKTGRRSVISYLLSPISRYAHDSFSER
jgi:hemolysin D